MIYLFGVDPSLTSTGCSGVLYDPARRTYTSTYRYTIRTGPQDGTVHDRLRQIVRELVGVEVSAWASCQEYWAKDGPGAIYRAIVVEDPTEQKKIALARGKHSPRSIAVLGAAVGAVLTAMDRVSPPSVVAVPPSDWIGSTPHKSKRRDLQLLIRGLDDAQDDAIFAAGVARWWCEKHAAAG